MPALAMHEERCQYRIVHCPAKHRNTCLWQGSLAKMIQHVRELKCIQILHIDDAPNSSFRSFIGDFSDKNITVFNRSVVTHWKPIMLVSRAVVQYLLYLTIQRSPAGDWYLQIRSFSPDSVIDRIRVEMSVFNTGRAASLIALNNTSKTESSNSNENIKNINGSIHKYTYEGGVVSHTLMNEDVIAAGKFLILKDAQMKLIRTDNAIFEYSIKIYIRRQ
jgi:hypothetical protein